MTQEDLDTLAQFAGQLHSADERRRLLFEAIAELTALRAEVAELRLLFANDLRYDHPTLDAAARQGEARERERIVEKMGAMIEVHQRVASDETMADPYRKNADVRAMLLQAVLAFVRAEAPHA